MLVPRVASRRLTFSQSVERIVRAFELQEEPKFSHTVGDSDWGGNVKDRKSTSGGVWMLGKHCIKTWCASQGALALSSAEAEFYAMVEAVTLQEPNDY